MRKNNLLHSCFDPLSSLLDAPGSPSSIVSLNAFHPLASQKMFAITKDWVLDGDILRPSKQHLYDYCRRVARLLNGDRVVRLICKSPTTIESCSLYVHLSRIQTQGGKLSEHVSPHICKSSSRILTVNVQESGLGMLAVSDFLYRSHIDFADLDASDLFEIAGAALRWECRDLFIGSLIHTVLKQRLDKPLYLRESVSFQWLGQAPLIFCQYFRDRADIVFSSMTFLQILEVLQTAYLTFTTDFYHQVLHFIVKNDYVQTAFESSCLLRIFLDIPIPSLFKEYFSGKLQLFFFELQLQGYVLDKMSLEGGTAQQKEFCFVNFNSRQRTCRRTLVAMLHKNQILFDILRRIDGSSSNSYDPMNLFWTILHDVEPIMPDETKLVPLLRQIYANIDDRQKLASDEANWKRLSRRAMRIAAVSLCSRRSLSPTLQLSINIPWNSISIGSSTATATGSIADVKFELKARSTSQRKFSWRLYYSNVEGSIEPRAVSHARVSYEFVNTRCHCDEASSWERVATVKLKDRSLRNGSAMDLHTEGELTLLSEEEATVWSNRHQASCALTLHVLISLS